MTPNLDPHNVRTQIETLKVRFPEIWAEGDDTLLLDCLEAETTLLEFLRVVEDRRQDAKAMAGGIATRIAELEIRQGRYEQREKAMRALAMSIMETAGVRSVALPEATLAIQKGRQNVAILDEPSIPDSYCKFTRSPDKEKIKAALEAGERPNWAAFVTGPDALQIRTK